MNGAPWCGVTSGRTVPLTGPGRNHLGIVAQRAPHGADWDRTGARTAARNRYRIPTSNQTTQESPDGNPVLAARQEAFHATQRRG